MDKIVLWGRDIERCFLEVSEFQLDDFLELLQHIQTNNDRSVICETTLEKAELWEWLYSKNPVELNDIKRELRKRIEKVKCVSDNDFNKFMDIVGKCDKTKTLVLLFNEENIYYICTIKEYYVGIRSYLAMEKKDEFCKDLQECFPDIYFSEGIETTINTLNRKFEDIRDEIVEHLTQINNYKTQFGVLLGEHKSFQEIAQAFTNDTGIECSPQAGRGRVQVLKEKYVNIKSGKEEIITCELHTKFKKYNIDREKQDRIYFFPGKQGVMEGKVIVKHIGMHL